MLVLNANNVPMVLGSNHVLARSSSGADFATAGERILQPSLQDLGCWQDGTDAVARLTRWVPIHFTAGSEDEVDADVAKVIPANVTPGGPSVSGVDTSGTILNIGQVSTPFPDGADAARHQSPDLRRGSRLGSLYQPAGRHRNRAGRRRRGQHAVETCSTRATGYSNKRHRVARTVGGQSCRREIQSVRRATTIR